MKYISLFILIALISGCGTSGGGLFHNKSTRFVRVLSLPVFREVNDSNTIITRLPFNSTVTVFSKRIKEEPVVFIPYGDQVMRSDWVQIQLADKKKGWVPWEALSLSRPDALATNTYERPGIIFSGDRRSDFFSPSVLPHDLEGYYYALVQDRLGCRLVILSAAEIRKNPGRWKVPGSDEVPVLFYFKSPERISQGYVYTITPLKNEIYEASNISFVNVYSSQRNASLQYTLTKSDDDKSKAYTLSDISFISESGKYTLSRGFDSDFINLERIWSGDMDNDQRIDIYYRLKHVEEDKLIIKEYFSLSSARADYSLPLSVTTQYNRSCFPASIKMNLWPDEIAFYSTLTNPMQSDAGNSNENSVKLAGTDQVLVPDRYLKGKHELEYLGIRSRQEYEQYLWGNKFSGTMCLVRLGKDTIGWVPSWNLKKESATGTVHISEKSFKKIKGTVQIDSVDIAPYYESYSTSWFEPDSSLNTYAVEFPKSGMMRLTKVNIRTKRIDGYSEEGMGYYSSVEVKLLDFDTRPKFLFHNCTIREGEYPLIPAIYTEKDASHQIHTPWQDLSLEYKIQKTRYDGSLYKQYMVVLYDHKNRQVIPLIDKDVLGWKFPDIWMADITGDKMLEILVDTSYSSPYGDEGRDTYLYSVNKEGLYERTDKYEEMRYQ